MAGDSHQTEFAACSPSETRRTLLSTTSSGMQVATATRVIAAVHTKYPTTPKPQMPTGLATAATDHSILQTRSGAMPATTAASTYAAWRSNADRS